MTHSTIHVGDCRESMAAMPAGSVQCVVTSPPYWGLRDYGTAEWEGGDAGCDHVADPSRTKTMGNPEFNVDRPSREATKTAGYYRDVCPKCGARRVDRQLGLESTPDEFLAGMVDVFRAVRRVLRDDGVCWVNMGDGYANTGCGGSSVFDAGRTDGRPGDGGTARLTESRKATKRATIPLGLKPKDLIGMPWRLAFALQADGWWLRSDVIWAKPNPMPESVTDRPTKSHEHVFLLTKRPRYFYDADAVREGAVKGAGGSSNDNKRDRSVGNSNGVGASTLGTIEQASGRNLRDVWTIPTEAYADAHFATFPRRLVEPCIKAGTSDKGCCPECGAPWRRVVESLYRHHNNTKPRNPGGGVNITPGSQNTGAVLLKQVTTVGWEPGCECGGEPVPCVVLDPFAGSGTTGVVAKQLGRSFVGCELNPEYAEMARKRIANPEPLPKVEDVPGQGVLDFA